jgi:class I lanthipeptide synthase
LKAKAPFTAFDFFIFRTPLLPFGEFLSWSEGLEVMRLPESAITQSSNPAEEDTDHSTRLGSDHDEARLTQALDHDRKSLRERLKVILSRPEIRDALFVASPNIIERFHLWTDDPDSERGRKVEHVLVRYFSRMAGRATPFGLFAGVSTGTIDAETNLALLERAQYRRHTRLDMDYLYALTDAITRDPSLRNNLIFHPNSSLYRAAGRARYVESRLKEKERLYHLVAVEETDYLSATIKRAGAGATPDTLAAALVNDEISLPDAREYIAELIDSQILVPAISLNVSGPEPVHPLIEQLRTTNETAEIGADLERTYNELESIDHDGLGVAPERYRSIARALEALPAKVELTRLFQVDMTKPAPEATLGREVLDELERGVEILHRLSARRPNRELSLFREAFARRYEDREVPLVEALDEEIGVGFGNSEESAPLLKGLDFPPLPEEAQIDSARQEFMLSKLCESLSHGAYEIHLELAELETIKTKDPLPLPDSFAIEATVAARSSAALAAGDFRVVFGAGNGPSGAILLGRFCHADPSLEERVRAMLRDEESRQPEAIFAEIVHLPEGRLGNVISRPRMREYEIPYLARSVAEQEYQIPVADLLVSVKSEHVLLRSARLQREVIPRLTNAHNFSWKGLGIYKFLCLLQSQRTAVLPGWDWGALAVAPFLPRVCVGRLVLSLARWRLAKAELGELAKVKGPARFRAVQSIRSQQKLPRFIALADGDNLLPVDLDNVLSVDSFTQLIKEREAAVLIELFPGLEELCATGPEGSFVHELIVPFVTSKDEGERMKDEVKQRPADSPSSFIPHPSSFRRRFPPGSEWLYAKLYCGSATADVLLRDLVREIVNAVKAAHGADLWFFIRYGDPDWHLRLRFHGPPQALQQTVLPLIHEKTAPFIAGGQIWRTQLDTYEREVERYGGVAGIELAERLFHADSEAVLQLIESLEPGDAGADERWRLTVYGIDRLLADFGFDLTMRHSILKNARDVFAKEFRVEKNLWSQLSDRFRKERRELRTLLDASPDSDHPLAPGVEILHQRSRNLANIVSELRSHDRKGGLSLSLPELMPSYIHMHANRLLRSAQRQQELLIYDLLTRLYESQLKRNSG